MSLRKRERRRSLRQQSHALAWALVAAALYLLFVERDGPQAVFGLVIAGGMLLWLRLRPLPWPEHLASVACTTRLDDYDSPDALAPGRFYLAWCDCGWMGDGDHPNRELAEREARAHTPHVRPGLHELLKE